MSLIEDLPLKDFYLFADEIVDVIRNDDPTYTVYHADPARQKGLAILDRLNIEEGISLSIETIRPAWTR